MGIGNIVRFQKVAYIVVFGFAIAVLHGQSASAATWPQNYHPNAVGDIERRLNWRDTTSANNCAVTHDNAESFMAVYVSGSVASVTFTLSGYTAVSGGASLYWNQSSASIYSGSRNVDCNTHPDIVVNYANNQAGTAVATPASESITLVGGTYLPSVGKTQFLFHLYLTNLQPAGNDLDTVGDVDQGYKYYLTSADPAVSFGAKANYPVSVTGTTSSQFMNYSVTQNNCSTVNVSGTFLLYDSDNRGPAESTVQTLDHIGDPDWYKPLKLDLLAGGVSTVPPTSTSPATLTRNEGTDWGWYDAQAGAGQTIGHYTGFYSAKVDGFGPPYQPVNSTTNQTNTLTYTFAAGQNYAMLISDVGDDNFLTFAVPFDEGPACATWSIDGGTSATIGGVPIASGAVVDVGTTVVFAHGIYNNGPNNTTLGVTGYRYTGSSYTGSSFSLGSGATPTPAAGSSAGGSYSVTLNTAGQYCEHVEYEPSAYNNSGRTVKGDFCVTVVMKPYFSVNGGDIAAGSTVESAGSCGPSIAAIIKSYDSNSSSGGQFAAFAPGLITGFATARAAGLSPSGLAFANSGYPSGENYGGGYNPVPCIRDYWASPATSSIPPGQVGRANPPGLGDGSYQLNPNTINATTIDPGVQQIIYVPAGANDDLVIRGNIVYAGRGAWANAAAIPGAMFVVPGDIYIDRSVTQLDGIYVAGGNIYTCTNGGSVLSHLNGATANVCDQPLTINGAFIANKINFERTRDPATGFAETFNYRPELWLAQWPSMGTSASDAYNAITSLPPVL